jgi:hypothetical protein
MNTPSPLPAGPAEGLSEVRRGIIAGLLGLEEGASVNSVQWTSEGLIEITYDGFGTECLAIDPGHLLNHEKTQAELRAHLLGEGQTAPTHLEFAEWLAFAQVLLVEASAYDMRRTAEGRG